MTDRQVKPSSNTQIYANITRIRRLSIGSAILIAFLASAMLYLITSALDDTAATKVNIAGRQRMLAQKVLTNALKIDSAAQTQRWDDLEPALRELNETINQLTIKHSALLAFNTNTTLTEQNAYKAIELPFNAIIRSGSELNKLTLSMIRRAPYLDSQTLARVTLAKNEIAEAHSQLLPGMEAIADQYEQEYKDEIAQSIYKSKIGMVILFVVLATTILFVIEPAILIIRRQLRDLEKANRTANRAQAVRWRLLTNIGHEFRTPMNAIMGFADLLKADNLSETERSRIVNSVFESSTQLTALIETMLDMSAIQSGKLRVSTNRFDLHQTLANIKAQTSSKTLTKSLNLNLIISDKCPQHITSDPKRLTQILHQVVDNAIKFTEKGYINIQADIIDSQAGPLIEIKVIDTGIGVDPKIIESIFDPFHQAEDSLTRDFGGAGLGLAVSRDVARALGGDIVAMPNQQQGSTFIITIDPGKVETKNQSLPQSQQTAQENSDQEQSKPLEHQKILVVDDAKDNRMLLMHILKNTGAQLEFASDGKQALDAIETAIETEQPFGLILMDMQMPVMDGYEATMTLRKKKNTIPVIAVTAHALEGDRQHCLDAGCNEYLTKPVKKKLLIDTCVSILETHDQQNNPPAQAA